MTENNNNQTRTEKRGKRMKRVLEVKSMHREKERETKDENDNPSGDS
jgi:hypothetical protein